MTNARTYGLTLRAQELLGFLRSRMSQSEVAPTYREMADAIGVKSVSDIARLIEQLEHRGYVRRRRGCARSLNLVEACTFELPRDVAQKLRADAARRGLTPEQHLADAALAFLPSPATASDSRNWRSSPSF